MKVTRPYIFNMGRSDRQYFILSEMFYPDEVSTGYVMTEIAARLGQSQPVNVICGPSNYETEVFVSQKPLKSGINILRVKIANFNKNKLAGRSLRMLILTFKMGALLFKKVKKDDIVILVTNPAPLLVWIAFLKRIKKFKYYIIVHDVFPENAASAGILKEKSLIYKLLKKLFDNAYNAADKLITVGEDMKILVQSKTSNQPISVITNWADSEEIYPHPGLKLPVLNEVGFSGKIIIQFAGNIGRVQALDNFVKAFEKAANPNVVLMIIGSGAQKSEIQEYINEKNIPNILIVDALPREMQNTFLNSCNIGLVSLSKGMFGLGVPSKSYNILAAGKPILYVGDKGSEISNYIAEGQVGWSFDWDNEKALIEFIASLSCADMDSIKQFGQNARRMVDTRFTKEHILNRYKLELLTDVA